MYNKIENRKRLIKKVQAKEGQLKNTETEVNNTNISGHSKTRKENSTRN